MSNINSSSLVRLLKVSLDRADPLKKADLRPVGDRVEVEALRAWLARRALGLLQPRLDPSPQTAARREFEDGQVAILMELFGLIENE